MTVTMTKGKPAPEEAIRNLEDRIGCKLSEPYRKFLTHSDGAELTCHRIFIQRRLESRRIVRRVARVEQWAIGGAGRDCAADRPLR